MGYLELLRGNANFRNLWLGDLVSLLGDWFNLIATATLVATLTGSGVAVGGLLAIRMLSVFFASPFAGVAADRFDRKTILIVSDLLRAVVVLGFLLVQEPGDVWLLYVLTCIQMALSGFFFPARRAILPDVVEPAELGTANALSSATWSVMLAIGAGLGGVVAGTWGLAPAFLIDAATFLVSVAFLTRVKPRPTPVAAGSGAGMRGALRQYVDGLKYLVRAKDILAIAMHKPCNALFVAGGFGVIQVVLTREVFVYGKEGSLGLGLLYACVGIGTGFGPLIARRFTGDRHRPMRVVLGLAYLASALGLLTVGLADVFWVVLLGGAIRGFGGGTGWVFSTQLMLVLVPNHVRGRVFSTEFATMTLFSAAGSFGVGVLLDSTSLGVQGTLFLLAGLALIPAALWTVWIRVGTPASPPRDTRR